MVSRALEAEVTVEQLARRIDMSVRNIREYQRLGLLAPPVRRGRVGYYDASHVARMERVQALRKQGFSLELIRRVLDAPDDAAPDVAALATLVAEPFQDEVAEPISREAYASRFKAEPDSIQSAIDAGLIRERADGELEIASPRLAAVGDAMVAMGLTLDEMLALMKEVRAHQDAVAQRFLALFREQVWEPYEAAGSPPEGLPIVHGLLELVRPRAMDTVTVAFQMAMDAGVKALFAELDE